ncbi:MAG: TonB family protein [Verrucomicrobia bacterium]|nr:TonB family protein [Verrucomicrobiota bacterium]
MNSVTCVRVAIVAGMFLGGARIAAVNPRSDEGLKIIPSFAPYFPPSLLAEGITSGFVQAVLHVGADGRVLDHLVLACSHRELLAEFQAGLREWEFVPARRRGEPIAVRTEVVFHFEARGAVVSLTATTAATAATRWVPTETISLACTPRELDRPPAAQVTISPTHPGPRLQPPLHQGSATVDFYVDAEGRPRMPVVVASSHEAFGDAAIAALLQWRFSPPLRAGQPTAVRVRQTFVFTPPTPETHGTD